MVNRFHVKHKRQSLADFNNSCHRFKFWYNGKEMEVSCYCSVSVFFDDENIPEDIKQEVQKMVYNLIDKNESKWSIPSGAKDIFIESEE